MLHRHRLAHTLDFLVSETLLKISNEYEYVRNFYNEGNHQEAMGLRVEERIANAICKNPRIMKAGITLEFKEVITKVSFGITIGKLTT